QHRIGEKTFLARHGIPVVPFAPVRSEADLQAALASVGCPAVLKTATFGYDGKGQVRIATSDAAIAAWRALGSAEAVLEAFVDLEREISVIGARGVDGGRVCFAPFENAHCHHILDVSVCPAEVPAPIAFQAQDVSLALMYALDYVVILCYAISVVLHGH